MSRPPQTGWYWLDNATVDRLREVGVSAFAVYAVLVRLSAGRRSDPSAATIARLCGLTRRSVFRTIRTLEAKGWIRVARGQGRSPNGYIILPLVAGDTQPPQEPGDTRDTTSRSSVPSVTSVVTQGTLQNPVVVTPGTHIQEKTREKQDKEPGGSGLTLENLVSAWNRMGGVSSVRTITASRQKAFRARATDSDWLRDVPAALEKVKASSFCRGRNDRGWRADIDWFLRPDTLTRILEGKYDNRNSNGAPTSKSPAKPFIDEPAGAPK